MSTMLIACNETRESGSFMGDQLCSLKTAYLMVRNEPDVDRVLMSVSRANEMHFLWERFIREHRVELFYDDWNPGDWHQRWEAWDRWRKGREIGGVAFDHYRELYLRIHGPQRQRALCGSERGAGRRNIYEYWYCGQEHCPEEPCDVEEWNNLGVATCYSFGDDLIDHPRREPLRDVYVSPHAKTQGNFTFTFQFWDEVVRRLLDDGVSVTVGYDGPFCEDLSGHPLYRKFWGSHRQWMEELCRHRLVACGNTGTGWLAAACGVPMITMEPPGSQMPDHRFRECGLRNLREVVDAPDAMYVARRIADEVKRRVVMTSGCYDILHAGHVRHLERSRSLGTKLIVALNSDASVRGLKGPERPINPQHQRKAVLEALRCVDEVVVFDGPDPRHLIEEMKPDVLAAGYGYSPDKIVGRDMVEGWGGRAVVTCAGDARDEPSTTKIVQRVRATDVAEICRIGASSSVNPFEKLKLMAEHFLTVKDLPGDVADLGACRGGTSLILRRLAPDKHLHLFDTWMGTPYDDPLCHHKTGEWAASLEECRRLVGTGHFTHYHPGIFSHHDTELFTRDDASVREFCFVYVDMDTERATRDALEFFWPRMVRGGKILVDDYGWEPCAGVKKAVDESAAAPYRNVIQSLYTCILEKR